MKGEETYGRRNKKGEASFGNQAQDQIVNDGHAMSSCDLEPFI